MIFRKKYKILTYTQNKTLRRITHEKELSILLAGVCLTAALYSAGTTYGQNKTNSAKQKEDTVTTNKYQGVTIKDKAKGKVTKQQVRELKKNTPVKMRKHHYLGSRRSEIEGKEMLIPDLIIQLITVVIGVVLYTAIFKIVKNVIL